MHKFDLFWLNNKRYTIICWLNLTGPDCIGISDRSEGHRGGFLSVKANSRTEKRKMQQVVLRHRSNHYGRRMRSGKNSFKWLKHMFGF